MTQHGLPALIAALERIAGYDGPWRPLRDEIPLLRQRIAELRERETRLDDLLVVALVGGSGVGKSTLLNALAGDQLAATSEMRPCTSVPTVYHPPGAMLPFKDWNAVSGSALERLIIVDTPDSDTVVREHRAIVEQALDLSDLVILCGSPEKYLDEASWSLVRPLQQERRVICVETKASEQMPSVEEHWRGRLEEQGFTIDAYFRVNALRALDAKLRGAELAEDTGDFLALERFLREELTREQVRRIKRSNALGLLRKTIARLEDHVAAHASKLDSVARQLDEVSERTVRAATDLAVRRLFAEPHLWAYALGREVSLRAKGLVGTVYRIVDAVRALPMRLGGWLPGLFGGGGAGRQAVALLSDKDPTSEPAGLMAEELRVVYEARHSEIRLACAQAGFDFSSDNGTPHAGFVDFQGDMNQRIRSVLRGPARDRLVRYAEWLTSWPATILADLPVLALLVYSGYRVVRAYFRVDYLVGVDFLHAAVVLALLLGGEIVLLSILARLLAWTARRRARTNLRGALAGGVRVFQPERDALTEAQSHAEAIRRFGIQLEE